MVPDYLADVNSRAVALEPHIVRGLAYRHHRRQQVARPLRAVGAAQLAFVVFDVVHATATSHGREHGYLGGRP